MADAGRAIDQGQLDFATEVHSLGPQRWTHAVNLLPAMLLLACALARAAYDSPAAPEQTQVVRAASEFRTRHAVFKLSSFDELPGWSGDDMQAGWSAFRNSCTALRRREAWHDICAASHSMTPDATAMRAFFESRFAPLRILNGDASSDGEITGYFEPLLDGRRQPGGKFTVPVMGVPRDLYTLDWSNVPKAQRAGIVHVKPEGTTLVALPSAESGAYALDLRDFVLDTRDRRLRVRLTRGAGGNRAEPYHSRAELESLGLPRGIDAPVLAWVADALALYAMQIQGSGRIRMGDGSVLRVQYAEQNGQPFKPLRVVAKASDKPRTRSIGVAAAEEFVIADADDAKPRMRGLSAPRVGVVGSSASDRDAATQALVEELLSSVRRAPAPRAHTPARSDAAGTPRAAVSASALASDPSYVFFKVAADQTQVDGPRGALNVPLTPGRSVAVDPRVTPLGYPVFLSAPAREGSAIDMQRLVFAQDTGGAIRGAVRADFFWGFGADAGQLARGTRHRGQMWLMVPKAEAERLARSDAAGVVTRGFPTAARHAAECLLADGEFCSEID
jgi:membrane-bound lytic murein transglycosylase A